jgi:hypothetical protein
MTMPRLLRAAAVLAVAALLGAPAAAAPSFDRVVDALAPQPCGGAGCWTNYLRVVDIDGDDDLDLVLANYPDFFDGGSVAQPLVIYRNDGTGAFTDVSAAAVGGFAGSLRQIATGDVDGNGAPDIYGPSGAGGAPVLFMNDGNGVFTDQAASRLPTSGFPASAATRMGDVDNDGDLDLFAADGYAVTGPPFGRLYRNDGTGFFSEVVGAVPTAISGSDLCDVELFDADRDFDLDLAVNAHSGGTGALWLNDGSGQFAAGGAIDPPADSHFHYDISPCDVDGDGDLDLWIDNIGGSFREQLLINDGAAHFTDETAARVSGNPAGADDNGVKCVDVDLDGDFDGVVVSLSTPERLLRNDGTGQFTFVSGVFPSPVDCSLWAEFGDLNGDGRLDLVTGQGECSSKDEVDFGNAAVPVDLRPPVIVALEELDLVAIGEAPAVRFAASDSHATDAGPRLARAYVEVDAGGAPVEVDARFVGGDLFRAVLPAVRRMGPVSYRACAEDPRGNVGCSAVAAYEVVGVALFADGFESGDTSAWSAP